MKIIANRTLQNREITEYLDFNTIPYSDCELWNPELDGTGRYELSKELLAESGTLLILGWTTFLELCSWGTSLDQVVKFSSNNKIWVWLEIDALPRSVQYQATLLKLDSLLKSPNVSIFIDGDISDRCALSNTRNILFKRLPYSFAFYPTRIINSVIDKVDCSKDFMLTTSVRKKRPHRFTLMKQLTKIDGLLDRGHVSFGLPGSKRIGRQEDRFGWLDAFPSMDLYLDSWLEIVPETLFKSGYFITEKTIKPISTKTPFLMVSNCFYLEHLRQQGLKTFDGIIDETYDTCYRIEDRVRLMLEQLQDIIKNGAESFYKECTPILEHNLQRLFELSGGREYEVDWFIHKSLTEIGFKF